MEQENCLQPYTAETVMAMPQVSRQKHNYDLLSPGCHRSPFRCSVRERGARRQGSHPYLTTTTIHGGVRGAHTEQAASRVPT